MNIPLPKLKAILLYFCSNTDRRFLGKTKLMKLFYFLDFMHLKKYGTPITYDKYVHLEHGPIPSVIKNLVDSASNDLDNSLLSDTIMIEHCDGLGMQRITATHPFIVEDERYFSATEMEIMRSVCQRFGDKNTKFIKDAAHSEAPWRKTAMLEEIPFSLVVEDNDCRVTKEEIEALNDIL